MKIHSKLDLSQDELLTVVQENHKATYKLLLSTFTSSFIWPLISVWLCWPEINHRGALAWLGSVAVVLICRLFVLRQWYKPDLSLAQLQFWENFALLLTFAIAALWGLAMYSIDISSLGSDFYFLSIIIFALIAASIGLASYWVAYFWVFTVPMICFFASSAFFSVPNNQYPLLLATLAFGFYLRQIVYTYHQNIVENTLLRERVEHMAADLVKGKSQAERLAESRKQFLASASHDLRQPMQAMNLFLTALKPFLKAPDSKVLFTKMEASTASMNELLNRILDISKLDSDTLEVSNTTFAINTLLQALQHEFQGQANKLQLGLHVQQCPDLATGTALVTSDALLLHRILSNLLANAINYTRSGSVSLGCSLINQRVVIDVIDTGVGIPLSQQSFIFDEFYQIANPERDRKKGLGLGLSIVKRLCDILDLEFDFESRPGEGSRFTIILAQELNRAEDKVPDNNDLSWTADNRIVVIIDDDESVLDGLATLFEHWQFSVVTAESGEQACQKLQQQEFYPGLIVSDYRLVNGETGIDAIAKVRSHLKQDSIPAIIISGDTAPERLSEVAQSGHLLLHKPVKPAFLRTAVQRVLNQE